LPGQAVQQSPALFTCGGKQMVNIKSRFDDLWKDGKTGAIPNKGFYTQQ